MGIREIEKISIFSEIAKYRRIKLINVVLFILKILSIPLSIGLVVIFFVAVPYGVKIEGVFEPNNKVILYSGISSKVQKILVNNGDYVSNGQALLVFKSNEIFSTFQY